MITVPSQDDNLSFKEVFDHPEKCLSSALSQLFSIVACAPDSLKHFIIPSMLRGHPVDSLFETGASENFISKGIQRRTYKNFLFGVISNLYADVVLGHSVLKEHFEILLQFEETQKRLVIDYKLYCRVLALNFEEHQLFQNLQPDHKSIATKLNNFDKILIKKEVRYFLKEGIIELSLLVLRQLIQQHLIETTFDRKDV